MKKVYFFTLLFFTLICFTKKIQAQTNLYIQGTATWNTTNTNWGIIPGSSGNLWSNNSVANFETSPVITLNGFNPFAYGVNCNSTGSLIGTVLNERLYLPGTTTPAIDVSSSQNLTLNNILAGGMGISKTSAGILTLGNISNRFFGTLAINGGTVTFTDVPAPQTGNSALRLNPVNLNGNTLTTNGFTNSTDIRVGSLTGNGTLTSNTTGNGIFQTLSLNSSSSAAITTGTGGMTVRGMAGFTQTLTGDLSGISSSFLINGVSMGSGSGSDQTTKVSISGSGATNALNASITSIAIRGGRLTLDNTTNNISRLGTAAANTLTFLGGTLEIMGNASGTSQSICATTVLGSTALVLNSGSNEIIVNTPSSPSGRTELVINNSATAFSLRGATSMVVNFAATGSNTNLGGAGPTDPRIRFGGTGLPFINATNNLPTNTAGATTYGFATVNGNSFAAYTSNTTGVTAATFTSITAAPDGVNGWSTANAILDYSPTINNTATGSTTTSGLCARISPSGGTSLDMSSFNLSTSALMLDGSTSFTILGSGANSFAGTRYYYVNNRNTTLTTSLTSSAQPFSKAGNGTLFFNRSSAIMSSNSRINIASGVLRTNTTSINLTGGALVGSITFRGGVFEISGGSNGTGLSADFRRPLATTASTDGSINWSVSGTDRGNGGFSAISSAASVNIGGEATPGILTWDLGYSGTPAVATGFVATGYSLIFGSVNSDARLTFLNPIALDGGTAGTYNAREIYVFDNGGTANDKTQLAGAITGSANSDLLKTGPGTLELNAANTYNGNTIVAEGSLIALTTGSLPAATSVLVKNGATLQLSASNTITDLVLESGSTLALGANTLTLTGNFTNNGGSITGTGTVIFNGTSQQYIDGVAATSFYNLTMNNSKGMMILVNTTVTNNLTLTSGIITTTASNLLSLGASASTSGASNTSFVNGPIKKTGNTNFTFPVGKTGTGYVPLDISNFIGGTITDAFTAQYIRGSARALGPITAGPGLDHVSGCDYWTLNKNSGSPTVDLTAFWSTNNVCIGTYINTLATLTIAHFDGAGWNAYAVSPFFTGGSTTVTGSITWSGVASFSPFSLASTTFSNPLPITLNYLNGTKQGSNHFLTWKVTCNTTPRATLSLERSADARNFSSIYSITADALRCQQPFDYTDAQPLKGMNYYRLKMTNADGKITYSNTIALLNAAQGFDIMNIAPNPVTGGTFKLNVASAQATKMNIVISDLQGRIVSTQTITLIGGYNSVDMNVGNLAPGTYNIQGATAGDRSRVIRFVKL